jgi:uncharacterized protein with HEPN domain
MTQRDPHLRIRHMLDHAREAIEIVRGRTREDLDIVWRIVETDLPALVDALQKPSG